MTEIGKSGRPLSAPVQKFFSIFLNSGDEKNGRRSILCSGPKNGNAGRGFRPEQLFTVCSAYLQRKKLRKISNSHGNGKGGSRTKIDFTVF
ncbi:MAG: hypothetical protein V8T90_07450 [Victivallales bacterium]